MFVEIGQAATNAQMIAVTHNASAAQMRRDFEKVTRERRAEYLRAKVAASAKTNLDSALNFSNRRGRIQERMDADWKEAKVRAAQAQIGLQSIYKVTIDPDLNLSEEGCGVFTKVLIWVRTAISRLVAITRRDQQLVITVSIKTLAGDTWSKGFEERIWPFQIDADGIGLPTTYKLCRLRGIGVSIITSATEQDVVDSWTGNLTIATEAGSQNSVDYHCIVPRIRPRHHLREPDRIGEIVLHNVNPFSGDNLVKWSVAITKESLRMKPIDPSFVEDIWIDLLLAVQV